MISLNRATILGRLTRDPEMRYTPNGRAVSNFGVATNRRFKTADGTIQDQTEFHDVVAWGKLAEIAHQMLHKGEPVYVEGRLQTRSWESPDGNKRQKTEVVAESLIALAPRAAAVDAEAPAERETTVESAGQAATPAEPEPESEPSKKPKKSTKKTQSIEKSAQELPPAQAASEEINLEDLPF